MQVENYDIDTGKITYTEEEQPTTAKDALVDKFKLEDGETITKPQEAPDDYIKPNTNYSI